MTHTLSKRIETRLSTDRVLGNLQMTAGWRDKTGKSTFPLAPGAREVRIKVQINAFKMVVRYPWRLNAFAPVCQGIVNDTGDAGSVIDVYFRLRRSTQIFLIAFMAMLVSMTSQFNWHQVHAFPGLLPPVAAFVAFLMLELLIVVPIAGVVALISLAGFRAERSQELMQEVIREAASPKVGIDTPNSVR
jgi:hypothetical protein